MKSFWYDSKIGKILLTSDGEYLTGLYFENQKYFPKSIGDEINLPIFDQTINWLELYFAGRNPEFIPRIKISGTEFQKIVYESLLKIPFGTVETYGKIAKNLNTSARAVGNAVAKNPNLEKRSLL